MKKIAIEEHFHNDVFLEYDEKTFAGSTFPNLNNSAREKDVLGPIWQAPVQDHRLPVMDKYDIEMQIISPNTQAVQSTKDPIKALEMAHHINDLAMELVQKAPTRLRAFALLPMQNPQGAVEELRLRVKEQGFVGAFVHGHTNFSYYDEIQYNPVWEALQELDVPLYMHVTNPEPDQIRMYEGYEELLGNTWNWGYVATTHALRIIFGGVFERFPGAKLILGHMGETLPYMLGRLDEGYECRRVWEKGRISSPPSTYMKKNLYVAASGGYNPEAMRCAIDALGMDKVMFATDYPHYATDRAVAQIESSKLSQAEMEAVCDKNAQRIFRI